MVATLDPKQAEYLQLLAGLSEQEKSLVIATLKRLADPESKEKSVSHSLTYRISRRSFSESERIQLELDSLMAYFQRRRELLKDCLTTTQVAELLGTSRQTPHDRLKNRSLIGILENGFYRFPLWQFDPEGPDGVICGLPAVIKALDGSDFAKLNWLNRPNPILDGLTPITALKQGQQERVLQEASALGYI